MKILNLIIMGLLLFSIYEIFLADEPMSMFVGLRDKLVSKPTNTNTNQPTNNNNRPAVPVDEAPVINVVPGVFNFEVDYFDVGQGDSILIHYPSDEYVLIDGGTRYKSTQLIQYLQAKNITSINTVIATHNDADHIGGLPKVFTYFPVKNFLRINLSCDTLTCEELMRSVAKKNTTVINANSGITYFIDNLTRTQIMNPPPSFINGEDNTNSIVIKITYGSNSFLFTGDCDYRCEKEMIGTGKNLDSDVLKVANHGGNTSTNSSFITAVSPQYSVISVGKDNGYGHPSKDVLMRLVDTKILRTDELGTIIMKSDGEKIEVSS